MRPYPDAGSDDVLRWVRFAFRHGKSAVPVPASLAHTQESRGRMTAQRQRRHRHLLLACVAVLAAACAWPAAARTWHVSGAGSDSQGDGSSARPFRSIRRVIDPEWDLVSPGDVVELDGRPGQGRYDECDVRLRVRLTLRSAPGGRAHIHCDPDTPDSVTVQIDPDASGSVLSNLEISGGHYYGVMLQTNWYQGGPDHDTGANDVVLEDLLIRDTGRDGIKITPRSRRTTIRRVEIHGTGRRDPENADGIDNVNGDGMVVEDSYIHDIATTGLYFKGGARDVVVQRNRIENTGDAGILAGFDTSVDFFDLEANPRYHEAIRGVVRNNVVRNTRYAGIGLYATLDTVVAHNTIIDAAREGQAALFFGIVFQDWHGDAGRPPNTGATLVNNLVVQEGGNCVEIRWSPELGGLSALAGQPRMDYNAYPRGSRPCRFLDQRPESPLPLPAPNLERWSRAMGVDAHSVQAAIGIDDRGRPLPGSPVVGAGTPLPGVGEDIEGAARSPSAPTIGAYEAPADEAAAGAAVQRRIPPVEPEPGERLRSRAGDTAVVAISGLVRMQNAWPRAAEWMTPMNLVLLACTLLVLAVGAFALAMARRRNVTGWLLAWMRQDWRAPVPPGTTRHLLFCFVDHYEPAWGKPDLARERERVERWRVDLPKLCANHRDADGRPPVHTFFYPEEEYREEHLDKLVELCRQGLGEIEIHLHHDDDTEANLRATLVRFTELLASRHDALPRDPATGQPRWAFIHGNWALDNSHPTGRHCGVDNELTVLRETGCYADFTLPAAPDPCQTRTVNRIYYAKDDPSRPKSHDTGPRVKVGGKDEGDLMIIQGPLGFRWKSRKWGLVPRIENSDIRAVSPATRDRIDAWVRTGIHVEGRPEWIFVKIHTHGAEDMDMDALLGKAMDEAHTYLETRYNDGREWKLHYVSAREAYNIAKAAEAGLDGDPGLYRDYVIPRPGYGVAAAQPRRVASA
jgi:hypothetical protein